MRWYKCVNVAAWEGLGAACTPHEVATTQLLVAVLDEELVLVLVEDLLGLHSV